MGKYDASIDRILTIEYTNIQELMTTLDRSTVEEVIDVLLKVKPSGHKVITAGCGTSGMLARRIQHTLNVVEIPAFFCNPGDAMHGGTGCIQKGDVVILISKGGNTKEITDYIPLCRKKEAYIIGVTQFDDSVLATQSDLYFKIKIDHEADIWNMCASASCNAIAAVFDAVAFTAVQYSDYGKEDLALIHPNGRVGAMLAQDGDFSKA